MKLMKQALALFLCFLMISAGPLNAFATDVSGNDVVVVETTAPTGIVASCEECGGTDDQTHEIITEPDGESDSFDTYEFDEVYDVDDDTAVIPCVDCGNDPCTCNTTSSCETCGNEPCICDVEEPAACEICNQTPCVCEQDQPGATEGHAEDCSQNESAAQNEIYDALMAAESVEDMYLMLLDFMNSDPEGLFALSSEELQKLYDYAAELNEISPSEDYADLCETLQYIAGEYDLNGAEILGHLNGEWRIDEDKNIQKNNNYPNPYRTLSGDTVWNFEGDYTVNLEQTIRIPKGTTLTINGNGHNATIQATAAIRDSNNAIYYMFRVADGGKLVINGVTIDGGSTSNLENRFLYVMTQTADEAMEFEANNITIQNFAYASHTILVRSNGDVKFSGGTIQNCRVTGTSTTGVIYLIADQDGAEEPTVTPGYRKFEMDGTTITNCKAEPDSNAGGIIRTNGSTLINMNITNTSFINNYSGGFGVLLWNATGKCVVDNCSFIGNTARKRGGAISSEGQNIEITNSHFENNTAGDFGGAICLFPYRLDGKDTGSGDDVLEMSVTIGNGCTFVGNRATKGGAVAILITASTSNNPTHLTVTVDLGETGYMRNNYTDSNKQTGVSEGEGGGAIYAGCTEKDTDATAYLNDASKVTLHINSGSFYSNTSDGKMGGAVLVDDLRSGNTGINSVVVSGGIFGGNGTANTAEYGGAIAIEDGDFSMTGGEICYNVADGDGGAVYVSGGSFTMSDGTIHHNTADENGGAAYVSGGNVTIHHGIVSNNSASDGGAIYMDGDDDTTLYFQSGQMNNNYASDDGGAIYATGGTLYIGLAGCPGQTRDNNNNVSDENIAAHKEQDTTGFCQYHPQIQGNQAEDVGGGIALAGKDASNRERTEGSDETLSGGKVHFYCGVANTNKALYKGVGLNVFMQGGEFHFYQGTNIGEPNDPDLIIIGGILENHDDTTEYVYLYYYEDNVTQKDDPDFVGMAKMDSYMNLPEGEYFWTADQNEVFVGWTPFGPNATDGPDSVRDKDDYMQSGVSIQINDTEEMRNQQNTYDGTEDKIMHLYAFWAPKTSSITYVDSLTEATSQTIPESGTTQYTLHKGATQTIIIPATNSNAHSGFAIVGWYLYQDEGQNANWCDANYNAYEPAYTGTTLNYSDMIYNKAFGEGGMVYLPLSAPNANLELTIDPMTFGNITLVADYSLVYGDLSITKSGSQAIDENQSFVFDVTSESFAANVFKGKINSTLTVYEELNALSAIDMQVVIEGDGSIVIKHLPLGTYKVTEDNNWSWRYTTTDGGEVEVTANGGAINFANIRESNSKWLSGDSYCENWWDGTTIRRKDEYIDPTEVKSD